MRTIKYQKSIAVITAVILLAALIAAALVLITAPGGGMAVNALGKSMGVSFAAGYGSADGSAMPEGAIAISDENQLNAFLDGSGLYGYLTADIELTDRSNYGFTSRIFDPGRTLDGNGHTIRKSFIGGGSGWHSGTFAFTEINYGKPFLSNTGGSQTRNNAYVMGGFLAVNRGSIKNIKFDFDIGQNKLASTTSADTRNRTFGVGMIIGANQGFVKNAAVKLTGSYFRFHHEAATSQSLDNTIVVGGFAGYNMGEIEKISMDYNTFMEANAKGNSGDRGIAMNGGIVGKMVSEKVNTVGTGITMAKLKSAVLTGAGRISAGRNGDSSGNHVVEPGAVVGSNCYTRDGFSPDISTDNFDNGIIDGVVMATDSVQILDSGSGNSDENFTSAGRGIIGKGNYSNAYYTYNYTGQSATKDSKSKAGRIYIGNIPNSANIANFVVNISIDDERNQADALAGAPTFNLKVEIEVKAEAYEEYVIYSADVLKIAAATGATAATTPIGGINYRNEDGSNPYFDDAAVINRKHAVGHITGDSPSQPIAETHYRDLTVNFGQVADLSLEGIDPVSGADLLLNYTGTNFNYKLIKNRTNTVTGAIDLSEQVNVTDMEFHALSDATYSIDGKDSVIKMAEVKMPGTYRNLKIASALNHDYGYVNDGLCLVAPVYDIQQIIGKGHVLKILSPDLTVDNPSDASQVHKEYTYTFSAPESVTQMIDHIKYTANDGYTWSRAINVNDNKMTALFNESSLREGYTVRFAGYGSYKYYDIYDKADKTIQIGFTSETASMKLIVDREAPVLTFVDENGNPASKPEEGKWFDTTQTVRFTVTDEVSDASVTVNDEAITSNPNGIYEIVINNDSDRVIKVTDSAGNVYQITLSVKVDTVSPRINIIDKAGNSLNGSQLNSTLEMPVAVSISTGISGYKLYMATRPTGSAEELVYSEFNVEPRPSDFTSGLGIVRLGLDGSNEYSFKVVSGAGKESSAVSVFLDINRTKIVLSASDIIYSGVYVNKEYDGTTAVRDSDFAKFSWNPDSPQYEVIKNFTFTAEYSNKNVSKLPAYGGNNPIIFKVTDPSGVYSIDSSGVIFSNTSITPKNIAINISDSAKAYGDPNPSFSYSFSGVLNNDEANFPAIELISDIDAGASVGDYTIRPVKTQAQINEEFAYNSFAKNYNLTVINNGTMTVTRKALDGIYTIANPQLGADYTGQPVEILAYYGDNQLLGVRYYDLNNGGILLGGAPVTVGKYRAELYAEDLNYVFNVTPQIEFEINRAQVNMYIAEAGAGNATYTTVYTGAAAPLTIVLSDGGTGYTVIFRDAENNILVGQPVGAGKYTMEVSYKPADTNFQDTYKVFDLIINKARFEDFGLIYENSTVIFDPNAVHEFGITLPESLTLLSGTQVTLFDPLGNPLADNKFRATAAGEYSIRALVTNPNFIDYDKTVVFKISHTEMGAYIDKLEFTYNGEWQIATMFNIPAGAEVKYTYNGDPQDVIFSGNTISVRNFGNYGVIVRVTAENYETFQATYNIQVKKAKLTYTFNGVDTLYDGNKHVIFPVINGLGSDIISYTLSANQTPEVHDGEFFDMSGVQAFRASKPGVYRIKFVVSNPNYESLSVSAVLNINTLPLDSYITLPSSINAVYDPNNPVSLNIGIRIQGASVNVQCLSGNYVIDNPSALNYSITATGTYRFLVTVQKENYTTYEKNVTVVVNEAPSPAVLVGESQVTYDGQQHYITLENLPPNAEITWYEGSEITLDKANLRYSAVDAGTYQVSVTVKAPNYKDVKLTYRLVILDARMPNEATAGLKDKILPYLSGGYEFAVNGAPESAAVNITITDGLNNAVGQTNGKYILTEPGVYKINVVIIAKNYQTVEEEFTWTINKGVFDITADNVTVAYDGDEKSAAIFGIPAGAAVTFADADGNVIAPGQNGLTFKDGVYYFSKTEVADYILKYTVTMENYEDLTGQLRLSITKNKFPNIKLNVPAKTYTGGELSFDIAAAIVEYVNGANIEFLIAASGVTISGTTVKITESGVYAFQIRLTKNNYDNKEISFNLTVNKALMNIGVEDMTVVYDGNEHGFEISGVPSGAVVTYNGMSEFSAVNAGVYKVEIVVNNGVNYVEYRNMLTLTINKAAIKEFYYGNYTFDWNEGHEPFAVNIMDADGNVIDPMIYQITWSHALQDTFNDAGKYRNSAVVTMRGNDNYLPRQVVDKESGAKNIDVIVNPKKIDANIYINMVDKIYDGLTVKAKIEGVPEGFDVSWTTSTEFVNAGSYTVTALISRENYQTKEITGYINIDPVQVKVTYFIKPAYKEFEQPRVVGRYTDINGKEINFLVDTSSLNMPEADTYDINVYQCDNENYVPTEDGRMIQIVVGKITATPNLAGIIGGAASGGVAVVGGITALVIILVKKKSSIKL